MSLQKQIEELASRDAKDYSDQDGALFNEFKAALNRGEIRAAERDADGKWHTNAWVKRGILLGFRMGDRKSTRLNSSHTVISYAVFCLKKKNDCHAHGTT